MSSIISRSELFVGLEVEVNQRSKNSRAKIVVGEIEAILTNSENHPHGILVKLTDGTLGRVQKISSSSSNKTLKPTDRESEQKQTSSSLTASELIEQGEGHFVEFKTSAFWSQWFDQEEIKRRNLEQYGVNTSRVIIAKSIASFLNTDGGILILGVKELKSEDAVNVVGVTSEFSKLLDKTKDGYARNLIDTVVRRYFPTFIFHRINDYIRISFEDVRGATVCKIDISKAEKAVFLNLNSQDIFVVRIGASSRILEGKDIVEYCMKVFSNC